LSSLNYDIILTGHSLGGGLATYAALYHKQKAVVFNAAGISHLMKGTIPSSNLAHQQDYVRCVYLSGDFATALGGQLGSMYCLKVSQHFIWRDSDGLPYHTPIDQTLISERMKTAESTPALSTGSDSSLFAPHFIINIVNGLKEVSEQ